MSAGADVPGPVGSDAWLAAELDRLLRFAEAAADPDGGFGYLDDDGRPVPGRPLELWITCRMTHVFALGHLLGRPGAAALAEVGLAGLRGRFHDDTHGGWWAQVDADGPVTTAKTAYEHGFVVLAASSATAAGLPGAGELLADAVAVLLDHFWDDEAGMLVEEWDAAWTALDGYRGVNANMHGVEALLAAADVLDDPTLRERAERILTRVVHDLAPAHDWRIPEHFDAAWTPLPDYHHDQPAHPFRPYGATIGHWLEWSRLTLHLRAALGSDAPAWMLDHAVALLDAAVREGWHADGADGFVYTVDWDGRPVVRQRMHWVVAEGVAAAAALHQATGDASYADLATAWWEYAAAHLLDTERGSWHHELGPDNLPAATTWAGKPDVYHAVGATLVPRLPLSPTTSVALREGLLRG
ncbi:N-acyl-D-glucosamine 2-epimerase [Marmoricola sp. Leaf446]|uniref:AGE family epimerase/isomerase n=1 Tax=Marmoricola sp. Leaf446 TaxID=1736379 RepID=UPI0006FED465|nr:AGE family epimerase/isomerase [Marmoricola sp. Leaf446]KQT91013.1 N-acyl-D-glucosamine 2-epimerase [Marmoricola sp. Leaf446]